MPCNIGSLITVAWKYLNIEHIVLWLWDWPPQSEVRVTVLAILFRAVVGVVDYTQLMNFYMAVVEL